jgi:hypothetical protein
LSVHTVCWCNVYAVSNYSRSEAQTNCGARNFKSIGKYLATVAAFRLQNLLMRLGTSRAQSLIREVLLEACHENTVSH